MPPSPSYLDDFKAFQEPMKRVANALPILLEEIWEPQHSFFDSLPMSPQGKTALPINDALLAPAQQTPAIIPPMCKWADKILYSTQRLGVLFLPPYTQLSSC